MKLEIPPGDFAGYIFDLDGTLVDTMPLHYRAWDAAMRKVGLNAPLDEELFYSLGGVPTKRVAELIAANNTVEEIRRFVEADSLGYLSLGGLREAVADRNHDYCYACYTGNYPTELVNIQELLSAKDRRG